MPVDMQSVLEAQRAASALAAIGLRGYPVPAAVSEAHACERKVGTIAHELPTLEPLPTDPTKLRASLAKRAADRRAFNDLRAEAEGASADLAASTLAATRAAIPVWLTALQADFATAWLEFRDVWLEAPLELSGWSTDEDAASHAHLLRSVKALDEILGIRVVVGQLVHEEGADQRNLLLVAGLPDVPSRTDAVEEAWRPLGGVIDAWAGGHIQLTTGVRPPAAGVAKWDALATVQALTVGLADIPELEHRTYVRDAWSNAMSAVNYLGGAPISPEHLWRELTP